MDEGHLVIGWSVVGWDSRVAVHLNTEVVVGSNWELEEAHLTPVGSPRVSTDPVLFTGVLGGSPSDNGDLVVQLWLGDVILVDAAVVLLLELVGGLDTAGDWTVLVELSLHLVNSRESVVERNVVFLVVNSPAFVLAGLSDWAWWPCAVLALVNSITTEALWIMSNVLFARGVWNTLHTSEFVDTTWVSTLARATSTAVDNDLSIETNWSWVLVSEHDVESISKGGGGTLSPA